VNNFNVQNPQNGMNDLTLKLYFKSLLVDLKYVYTKSGVVHSGNNVW